MSAEDPIARFQEEFSRAQELESFDAARCALATVGLDGEPSVRFVLVKRADEHGFVFYTNKESRKAKEIDQTPLASLAFHWHRTGIQVRVEGKVTELDSKTADAYFASRARGSQLGAWASAQSNVLSSINALREKFAQIQQEYEGKKVPRPPIWGGYIVAPERIEFWENRDDRLHVRELYTRDDNGVWSTVHLYP